MTNPLIDRALPRVLADIGQAIETKEKISSFPDLSRIVAADLAVLGAARLPKEWRQLPVGIRLSFGWTDARRQYAALRGDISARVPAVCQRCLEPMEVPLAISLALRLTRAGAAATPQEGFEDWELEEDTVQPLDIVQEALIMAMPLAALHPDSDDCAALAEQPRTGDTDMLRPFSDLQSRMGKAK